MKEIEVKAVVRDKDQLIAKLTQLGVALGESVVQDDIVFAEDVASFTKFIPNANFLRLRTQGGQTILTYKRSEANELSSTEHETVISNPDEMTAIIQQLGFMEAVRVNKTRRRGRYRDFEICLDEVGGLGIFIELEKLVDNGDVLVIQEELFQFLESLGISRDDQVTQGYDTLMKIKNTQ